MTTRQRYYGENGEEYEKFIACIPHHAEFQRLVGTVLQLRLVKIQKPTVLEIGCGTGFTTAEIINSINSGNLIAVDIDPEMVAMSKRKLGNQPQIKYKIGNILDIAHEFPEGSFDAIVSGYCLHNFQPIERFQLFSKLRRIVKPGGAIISGDKIVVDDILTYWQHLKNGVDSFRVFRDSKFPHLEEFWTQHYLEDNAIRLTESEQAQLFRIAWCENIQLHQRWGLDCVMSAQRIAY